MGKTEPSPTTSSFPLSPFIGTSDSPTSVSLCSNDRILKQEGVSNVIFKPLAKLGTRNPLPPLANLGLCGISHQQALAQVQAQAQAKAQTQSQAHVHAHVPASSSPHVSSAIASLPVAHVASSSMASSPSLASATAFNSSPLQQKTPIQSEVKQTIEPPKSIPQSTEQIQRSLPPIPVGDRPSYDGYNWRKYGQKQVKGSEYPRSYYKCTHPNCPVKKKVERSHDGQVTEIVYKGEHNHLKPQPTRRLATGAHPYVSDVSGRDMDSPRGGSCDKIDCCDVKADRYSPILSVDPCGMNEKTANISDPSTSVRGHGGGLGSPEQYYGLSDDAENGSRADDGDDDEPDSKRRKKDKKVKDLVAPLRANREPRVVVQTTDADILEDGFRWRKYGQKVVKGNPHPRSYYKCTNMGCGVRKHVERASNDIKAVITTYEGKHNHDAPVSRNNSHDASGTCSQIQSGNGADGTQYKQFQNRRSSYAKISESIAEGDRIHTGMDNGGGIVGVPVMGDNRQNHNGNVENAFGSDDNFASSGAMKGFCTETKG